LSELAYSKLRQTAIKTAALLNVPLFYRNHKAEIELADVYLRTNSLIKQCRTYLNQETMGCGHGMEHSEAVALDAGAIIQVESRIRNIDREEAGRLIVYAEISGLLHDIRRTERDHAIAGSNEARRVLNDFQIEDRYKRYIVAAIRNHEAFKELAESEDETARLIADSLYDADKFRWGPDNFTKTLWLLLDSTNMPLEALFEHFMENLRYIEQIKETFRTETGKRYGPEIIDTGIAIGNAIYNEMAFILNSM